MFYKTYVLPVWVEYFPNEKREIGGDFMDGAPSCDYHLSKQNREKSVHTLW